MTIQYNITTNKLIRGYREYVWHEGVTGLSAGEKKVMKFEYLIYNPEVVKRLVNKCIDEEATVFVRMKQVE